MLRLCGANGIVLHLVGPQVGAPSFLDLKLAGASHGVPCIMGVGASPSVGVPPIGTRAHA